MPAVQSRAVRIFLLLREIFCFILVPYWFVSIIYAKERADMRTGKVSLQMAEEKFIMDTNKFPNVRKRKWRI